MQSLQGSVSARRQVIALPSVLAPQVRSAQEEALTDAPRVAKTAASIPGSSTGKDSVALNHEEQRSSRWPGTTRRSDSG